MKKLLFTKITLILILFSVFAMAATYSKVTKNNKDYLEVTDTPTKKTEYNFETLEAMSKKWLNLLDEADTAGVDIGNWSKVISTAKSNSLL